MCMDRSNHEAAADLISYLHTPLKGAGETGGDADVQYCAGKQ